MTIGFVVLKSFGRCDTKILTLINENNGTIILKNYVTHRAIVSHI